MTTQRIIPGDCLEGLRTLPDASVHCCVTSPPYWGLRDYGHDGQIGLEATPEAYVARMVEVFREVRRVLREDGTLWLNLGDSYAAARGGTSMPAETLAGGVSGRGDIVAKRGRESGYTPHRDPAAHGLKHKDLIGIPWRVAFALQADGWWLRQDIIWHKPNPMPESVRDRCTKAHEYVFLLTKSERYFYDAEAVSEAAICDRKPGRKITDTRETHGTGGGNAGINSLLARYHEGNAPTTRNRRSVWTITTKPYSGAHFAVMPPDLVEPCIKAGCPEQCCAVCGKGWERLVERAANIHPGSSHAHESDMEKGHAQRRADGKPAGTVMRERHEAGRAARTLGFAPACDCAASGTTPGTVLDPFAGSGTTLAVAAEMGRNGIGCELNPEYIGLAERRIKEARAGVALFEGACA
jgi:DNA modification methylase